MTNRGVLVTGGAGYIGSHTGRQLADAGYDVVIYDNLSAGHDWAVLAGELVVGDLADRERLERLFRDRRFETVLHFAAHIVVSESVRDPLKYYTNNTRNTLGLLELCAAHDVRRFVFSSTAAVYGEATGLTIDETAPVAPISPYGASKAMSERLLTDLAAASPLDYVILRYFNVAGAAPDGRIGEAHEPETHLIPLVIRAAFGMTPEATIFGDDYPTPDGTCIRDYIHVEDLAAAHIAALRHLEAGGGSQILNCGYGRGASVREVIEAVKRASGNDFPVVVKARRPGDPPRLVADARRIRETLDWTPRHDDLDEIVGSAVEWERCRPKSQ